MSNWFYYDVNGKKRGPINSAQLRSLAESQVINGDTDIETEDGRKVRAGKIKGLFPLAEVLPQETSNPFEKEPSPFETETEPTDPSSVTYSDKFCTNCGNPISSQAVACLKCGADPRANKNYCRNCGGGLNPNQVVCISCGLPVKARSNATLPKGKKNTLKKKSKILAILLAIFLGAYGIHKFYLGDKIAAIYYFLFSLSGTVYLGSFMIIETSGRGLYIRSEDELPLFLIPWSIVWIMSIIDAFKIGYLPQKEFQRKYHSEK